jgi:transposase
MISGMYIRRTTIKSRKNGEPYFTYRLVESVRTTTGVRQRTILNLGRYFSVQRQLWPDLAKRIEEIILGQASLFNVSQDLEIPAQRYAAAIIQSRSKSAKPEDGKKEDSDYRGVDVNSLELTRPRSVGGESVCIQALNQLDLVNKFKELGFNKHQINGAVGTIIGRMLAPGSERATHNWLQNQSGLGELIDYDYESMSQSRIYQISDLLLKHKTELENCLYQKESALFGIENTITLYDLTNTYFEGSGKFNDLAKRGRSKEKRSDCPLVTLGLVLDSSGFPKKSKVFAGNASESKTLKEMIEGLEDPKSVDDEVDLGSLFKNKSIIVMDAGIATEENIEWLRENSYRYIVVSRKRHREFSEQDAVEVKNDNGNIVKAQKVVNEETGEIELYCHSEKREQKERAIQDRFETSFEEAMKKLNEGLHKKGCTKKYDKILEKVGRIKEKYSKAAQHYETEVKKDKETGNATEIKWKRNQPSDSAASHPGVYCLRTNLEGLEESRLWRIYIMLTDLEAVFRSLKSELGLQPNFHQKTSRVSGHLFISLLAYHLVHTIRSQLKKKDITSSWSALREQLKGQSRITATMQCANGETVHVRKSTRPEPRQEAIYKALDLPLHPGRTIKKVV